jgi:hypothetical protein
MVWQSVMYLHVGTIQIQDLVHILRVIECSNGVVQHMFRANDEDALSIEETRDAMKFSMGCMKTMTIPLKSHTVTFAEETASVMREVRELYISGFKNGNQEDMEEFIRASKANINSLGQKRILEARQIVFDEVDDIPPCALDWGLGYIFSLVGWYR